MDSPDLVEETAENNQHGQRRIGLLYGFAWWMASRIDWCERSLRGRSLTGFIVQYVHVTPATRQYHFLQEHSKDYKPRLSLDHISQFLNSALMSDRTGLNFIFVYC
jgi:hypothetical protein